MFQYHKHIPALRPVCAAVPFAAPFPMVQISGVMADDQNDYGYRSVIGKDSSTHNRK